MHYMSAIRLLLAFSVSVTPVLAQTNGSAPLRETPARAAQPPAGPRIIPAVVSEQTLDLPGHPIEFTAAVEFIRLLDAKNAPEADINTTAYLLKGADPATRPVTFVLNGGPGNASAWLQLGAVGPWRIDLVPSPSASPALIPNPDTWLDATDLVFIDPVGTGYSRFLDTSEDARKRLWSVDGDIAAISQTIRRWLDQHGRIASPKYLLGESYGGFRAPRLARRLAEREGVGLRGLVMVSPLFDFGNRSSALDLLGFAVQLPSMQAAVREAHGQPVTRADLAPAEDYAASAFMADTLRGPGDPAALDRVVSHVSELTGLDPALVRQRRGLISSFVFVREHDRATHAIDSVYDTTVSGADPYPENPYGSVPDPIYAGMTAPLTEAVLSVYDRLRWHPEGGLYQLASEDAFRQWQYGNAGYRPQSFGALRNALAADPNLHVVIAHGLFDLVCPYFGSQLLVNQIAPSAGADRVKLLTYPGGHMFYTRPDSRAALHAQAVQLIAGPR